MKIVLSIIISLAVVFVLITSGCVSNSNEISEKKIISFSTGGSLLVDATTVKNISTAQIESVQTLNYTYINASGRSDIPINHWFFKPSNISGGVVKHIVDISVEMTASNVSFVRASYSPDYNFKESELEAKKNYITRQVNEIVAICNLTVNWTQVQWTVNYAD